MLTGGEHGGIGGAGGEATYGDHAAREESVVLAIGDRAGRLYLLRLVNVKPPGVES